MTRYVAFLRAVNVGGTGKLPMAELRAMCDGLGFVNAKTYIASGNVVFDWDGDAASAQARLEAALAEYAGKPVGVLIRGAQEMAQVLADNPFADAPPTQVVTIFLEGAPPTTAAEEATGVNGELIALGQREIYVCYVNGQGASKLKIPAAAKGTARNLNTVSKMASWLQA